MRRRSAECILVILGIAMVACSGSKPSVAPDVVGQRLDRAEAAVADAGFKYQEVGGGAVGIVVKRDWTVCQQDPAAGASVSAGRIKLIVDRKCSSSAAGGQAHVVPDVVGQRLDVAESKLEDVGLGWTEVGGGALGIVVKSNWTVCQQNPAAGASTSGRVKLIVDRACPSSSG